MAELIDAIDAISCCSTHKLHTKRTGNFAPNGNIFEADSAHCICYCGPCRHKPAWRSIGCLIWVFAIISTLLIPNDFLPRADEKSAGFDSACIISGWFSVVFSEEFCGDYRGRTRCHVDQSNFHTISSAQCPTLIELAE